MWLIVYTCSPTGICPGTLLGNRTCHSVLACRQSASRVRPENPARHSDDRATRQRREQQQRTTGLWSSLCASPVSEHLNPEQKCHGFHHEMQFRRVSHNLEIHQHLQEDDRHWGTREARVRYRSRNQCIRLVSGLLSRRGAGKATLLRKLLGRKRISFNFTNTHLRTKWQIRHKLQQG